jgi:hypothetical protein
LVLMVFMGLIACVSCSDCDCAGCGKSDYKAIKAHGTMKLIDDSFRHEVWRDTETGCEYFVRNTSQGVAVIQLTDREGRPKVTEE